MIETETKIVCDACHQEIKPNKYATYLVLSHGQYPIKKELEQVGITITYIEPSRDFQFHSFDCLEKYIKKKPVNFT